MVRPALRWALEGWEGTKSCPAAGETHGSGFTPRAPSRSPAEPGSGAQLAALCARRGTWLFACLPPAPGHPPESPEESCAAPAARPCPPLARPSAYRSPPRLRPLGRRLPAWAQAPEALPGPPHSRAPGPPAPSEPSPQRARRAMGAGGRRATGRAAAASDGAIASGAGAGGWGVGERGGGRDAAGAEAQLQGGGNRNVTSAPGGEDGEGETGTPSRRRTPTSGPPRFLFLLLSRDSRLSAFPSTRAPTPRTPTLPGLFGFNLL